MTNEGSCKFSLRARFAMGSSVAAVSLPENSGMRVLVQRVSRAKVCVEQTVVGSIGKGLLLLAGTEEADAFEDADWLAGKIIQMRIFPDAEGVPNRSLLDDGGDILLVSQFTLHASTKKGNRPSYIRAASPKLAEPLLAYFREKLAAGLGKPVQTGTFGAHMQVDLVNDGPLTIWLDSRNKE